MAKIDVATPDDHSIVITRSNADKSVVSEATINLKDRPIPFWKMDSLSTLTKTKGSSNLISNPFFYTLSRRMSLVSKSLYSGTSCPSRDEMRISVASCPISSMGWAMVVMAGVVNSEMGWLSKPKPPGLQGLRRPCFCTSLMIPVPVISPFEKQLSVDFFSSSARTGQKPVPLRCPWSFWNSGGC